MNLLSMEHFALSEEEAKKKIYSVCTSTYTGFGALISEELSYKVKGILILLPLRIIPHLMYDGIFADNGRASWSLMGVAWFISRRTQQGLWRLVLAMGQIASSTPVFLCFNPCHHPLFVNCVSYDAFRWNQSFYSGLKGKNRRRTFRWRTLKNLVQWKKCRDFLRMVWFLSLCSYFRLNSLKLIHIYMLYLPIRWYHHIELYVNFIVEDPNRPGLAFPSPQSRIAWSSDPALNYPARPSLTPERKRERERERLTVFRRAKAKSWFDCDFSSAIS